MARVNTSYYHNDSILHVGKKFYGAKFKEVPAWYFLWLYEHGAFADLYLKEWIELNMEQLEHEKKNGTAVDKADYDRYEQNRKIRRQFAHKPLTTRDGDYIPPGN